MIGRSVKQRFQAYKGSLDLILTGDAGNNRHR